MILFFIFKDSLKPVSDGAHVWEAAHFTDSEHRFFKSMEDGWNIFTGMVTFFVNHFHVTYPVFMFALFVIDGLTALAVFLVAYEILGKAEIAFLRGLFYALNPDILMREFYFCGDVITVLFLTLAIYTFTRLIKEDRLKMILLYAVITGVFLGVGGCFKGIGALFLVSAFIVFILKILSFDSIKSNLKKAAAYVMSFLIIVGLNKGINRVGLACASDVLDIQCRNLLIWHQIEVGLNPYGYGNLGAATGQYTFSLRYEPHRSPEVARDVMLDMLKKDWQESGTKVLPWLVIKAEGHWSDGGHNFTKLMVSSVDKEIIAQSKTATAVYNFLLRYCYNASQVFYIFLLAMTAIAALSALKMKEFDPGLMIASLHIFGFGLMMLIVECQPRYKASVMTCFAVTAGYGLYSLVQMYKNKKA